MRSLGFVVVAALLVACQRAVDVQGLYVHDDGTGTFFPCDRPDRIVVRVSDSALATTYRLNATKPHELLFVRLLGVPSDSGSIYGGSHHLLVRQILEMRARRNGECPGVANPVARTLSSHTGLP